MQATTSYRAQGGLVVFEQDASENLGDVWDYAVCPDCGTKQGPVGFWVGEMDDRPKPAFLYCERCDKLFDAPRVVDGHKCRVVSCDGCGVRKRIMKPVRALDGAPEALLFHCGVCGQNLKVDNKTPS